jgi:3-dehydroquinate dehydratase-1
MLKGIKRPAICAAVTGDTEADFLDAVRKIENVDLIEVRIDSLKDPSSAKVKRLLRDIKLETKIPLILTNRRKNEGGAFSGTEDERIKVIIDCLSLVDMVDIELKTDESQRDKIIKKAKEHGMTVIISYHDFDGTPKEDAMLGTLEEEFGVGADIAKIAVKANSSKDVLRLLNVTHKASSLGDICTICMGEIGKISRVVAPLFGSVITYGYVTRETAPGQLSVSELKRILELLGVKR